MAPLAAPVSVKFQLVPLTVAAPEKATPSRNTRTTWLSPSAALSVPTTVGVLSLVNPLAAMVALLSFAARVIVTLGSPVTIVTVAFALKGPRLPAASTTRAA